MLTGLSALAQGHPQHLAPMTLWFQDWILASSLLLSSTARLAVPIVK